MSKYTMRDSTGQLWHDIDDSNLSDFMSAYPDAVLVSEEEDEENKIDQQVTDEGIDEEIVDTEEEITDEVKDEIETEVLVAEDTIESTQAEKDKDKLEKKLLAHNEAGNLPQWEWERLTYSRQEDLKNQLSEADKTLINQNKFQNLSIEGLKALRQATDKYQHEALTKAGITTDLTKPAKAFFDQVKEGKYQDIFRESGIGGFLAGIRDVSKAYGEDGFELLTPYMGAPRGTYEKDLKNALSKIEEGKPPTSLLDGRLGENLIGQEEEKVVQTLRDVYGEYGFSFEKSGIFTDNVLVKTKDGNKEIEIDLDNWTSAGDKENAAKLRKFLNENSSERTPRTIERMVSIANKHRDQMAIKEIV